MIKLRYLLLLLLLQQNVLAQSEQLGAGQIVASLQKLKNKARVLYIAAHPDDENTRLLTYLAKERNLKTGYLSLTRGDGGQNLIGNEQGELLGLIRTQELLAARKVDGAEQFFTRANDFGFSKTAEETLQLWDHNQILADVVWVIRKFRPDVIITRFPPDPRAGHGHHAASAILALEAFNAAGNPKNFPSQLQWVKPWQPKRILWNTYNFGNNNTTSPDQLKIDVGGFDPISGKSNGEIAAISRTNHKSQGFGTAMQRGQAFEFFNFTGGDKLKKDLFDGVEMQVQPDLLVAITQIQKQFDVAHPSKSIVPLLALKRQVKDNPNFNHALLDHIITSCAGLWASFETPVANYAVGDKIEGKMQAIIRGKAEGVTYKLGGRKLDNNQLFATDTSFVAQDSQLSQPYWLAQPHTPFSYTIASQQEVGFPENPSPLAIHQLFYINDVKIAVQIPVVYKTVDPVKGEQVQATVVAPKVTASLGAASYVFSNGQPQQIQVSLKAFAAATAGKLLPKVGNGWQVVPAQVPFSLKRGEEQLVTLRITPAKNADTTGLVLVTDIEGRQTNFGLRTINYPHIPAINYFPTASAKLVNIDLKTGGKNIAYIDGAGDLVAGALEQVGYHVTHLLPEDVLATDLSKFDAIVTGVRVFNVSASMKLAMAKLLAYVKNGGVLVEQYNVSNNLKANNFGPYPFQLVNKRVTEENATVTFDASADILNFPNKIDAKDFEGWVQERGIYFADGIDENYQTPLKMNDKNEPENSGALLVAKYGKGKYVYTSLVFYRELPAGVLGAYRLFANLLAKNEK